MTAKQQIGPARSGLAPPAPNQASMKQQRRYRPGMLALGALLVAGSMLAGLLLFRSVSTTVPVYVAAEDLRPGTVVQPSDVRVVSLSLAPDVNVLEVEDGIFLGGPERGEPLRALQSMVPAGTPLSKSHFVEADTLLTEDQSIMGVRLSSGDYPSGVQIGDSIRMYAVLAQDRTSTRVPDAEYLGVAVVRDLRQVSSEEDPTDDLVADLVVDRDIEARAVQANARDLLRLVTTPDESAE